MGIFDLLKNGRKKYRNEEKKRKRASPAELESVKFTIEQKARIVNDSFTLVEKTNKPQIFFSRYDTLMNTLADIIAQKQFYSNQMVFSGSDLDSLYYDLQHNQDKYIDKLIQRMSIKLENKIETLSTDKAKINHISKFKSSLLEYSDMLSSNQIKKIDLIATGLMPANSFVDDTKLNQNNDLEITSSSRSNSETSIYDRWTISISFGKSTSKNFEKAFYLAKASDRFVEDVDDSGNPLFQAFYFEENYLDFQRLYKIIGSWKSTFVFIDGELIDSKSLGKINICYGDKLKFHDPLFCYGASQWTSNPFGCHRLMLTPSQTPWWTFGEFNRRGEWIIDKEAIKEKIEYKSILFNKCPAFDKNKALFALELLPNKITRRDSKRWYFDRTGVIPVDYHKENSSIIKLIENKV